MKQKFVGAKQLRHPPRVINFNSERNETMRNETFLMVKYGGGPLYRTLMKSAKKLSVLNDIEQSILF
jgi:hypothetical protein